MEAALVLPLLFFLIFGMIDLGYAEFQTSQASSAARDGARVGILDHTDTAAIEAAVRGRLVGSTPDSITITCLKGLSGSTAVPCNAVSKNQDRIRVAVSWQYKPPAFVGGAFGINTISATATMVIVGRPVNVTPITTTTTASTTTTTAPGATTTSSTTTTTAPPGGCVASSITFDPAPLELGEGTNSDHLKRDTTFTVTTNGAATCSGLKIEYPTVSGPTVTSLSPAGPPTTWTDVVTNSEYSWAAGSNQTFRVLSSTNNPIGSFQFTIT